MRAKASDDSFLRSTCAADAAAGCLQTLRLKMSTEPKMERVRQSAVRTSTEVVENLRKRNLWKRMLKNTMATTMLGVRKSMSFDLAELNFFFPP